MRMVLSGAAPTMTSLRRCGQMVSMIALASNTLLLSACGGAEATGSVAADATAVTVVPVPVPSSQPLPSPTSTSVPSSPLPTTPTFTLGINVASMQYYSGEPVFSNLVTGDSWRESGTGWTKLGVTADSLGNLPLPVGQRAWRVLTPPASVLSNKGATVVCTWQGTGDVQVNGERGGLVRGDHRTEFYWPGREGVTDKLVWIDLTATSASDPVRDLDCREKGVARSDVFAAEFVDSLKPFGVLRFLDWSGANANPATVTWANRTPAGSIDQAVSPLGVSLEHQIALANRVNADPWFNVAWNADENYQRRMAQLVHDGIPANRHVYVELSNEVWNYSFGQTRQAETEGVAAGLSTDPFKAALFRYAEKTRWMMRIWSQVFADRPGQLVRVAAAQGGNPWTAEVELGEAKLAPDVDALAIAPYFGNELLRDNPGVTDTAVLMGLLATDMNRVMNDWTQKSADIAGKYGKRFIAYEAGQHVINGNLDLMKAVNRSEAMYDLYKIYINQWKTRFNDTMVLFNSTQPITAWGAWGLREYAGQPLDQTPKRRAAIELGR